MQRVLAHGGILRVRALHAEEVWVGAVPPVVVAVIVVAVRVPRVASLLPAHEVPARPACARGLRLLVVP